MGFGGILGGIVNKVKQPNKQPSSDAPPMATPAPDVGAAGFRPTNDLQGNDAGLYAKGQSDLGPVDVRIEAAKGKIPAKVSIGIDTDGNGIVDTRVIETSGKKPNLSAQKIDETTGLATGPVPVTNDPKWAKAIESLGKAAPTNNSAALTFDAAEVLAAGALSAPNVNIPAEAPPPHKKR